MEWLGFILSILPVFLLLVVQWPISEELGESIKLTPPTPQILSINLMAVYILNRQYTNIGILLWRRKQMNAVCLKRMLQFEFEILLFWTGKRFKYIQVMQKKRWLGTSVNRLEILESSLISVYYGCSRNVWNKTHTFRKPISIWDMMVLTKLKIDCSH